MKILIKVNRAVYSKAMLCGVTAFPPATNCAVAISVRDIDHEAVVNYLDDVGFCIEWSCGTIYELPKHAQKIIEAFDYLSDDPLKRLDLPEFSFEVDFPEAMIEKIGIGELYRILSESKTLEHVNP